MCLSMLSESFPALPVTCKFGTTKYLAPKRGLPTTFLVDLVPAILHYDHPGDDYGSNSNFKNDTGSEC